MAKIRILQVIGGNEIGGAEEHVLALCQGLDKENYEIYLACLCEGPLHTAAKNLQIPVITVPMAHPLDLSVIPKLVKVMRSWQINIVHTHGSRANLTARLAARWLNIPIVTTVHSSLAQDYTNTIAKYSALLLDRMTTPLARRVITISDYLQQEVKKRGAKHTLTIYNGINPQRFSGIDLLENIYDEFEIQPGTPLIGVVGRLHPVKGHDYFLQAASLVAATHPTVKFIIAGAGPLENELKQLVISLGLADKVIFTGFYPDVQRILAILDVFCLPSISEGMGLVLLEAMYFAKPVVATHVGGIPELVKHGDNGLLVPPADPILLAAAINRLLDDKVFAARLASNGQQTFEDFSLNRMLERTAALYNEVFTEENQPKRQQC